MDESASRPDCVIVTGTSRGLGAAIAAHRLAQGVEVIGYARGDNPALAEAARRAGALYTGHRVDFADPAAVDQAARRLADALRGRIDAAGDGRWQRVDLINNAGIVDPIAPLAALDVAAADAALRINVLAPAILTARLVAALAPAGVELRILDVSSGAGRRPIEGWGVYCTSKAALDMLARCTAAEAARDGLPVRISAVAPGIIDTAMQERIRSADAAVGPIVGDLRQAKAEGRLATPAATAAALIGYLDRDDYGQAPVSDIRSV